MSITDSAEGKQRLFTVYDPDSGFPPIVSREDDVLTHIRADLSSAMCDGDERTYHIKRCDMTEAELAEVPECTL